MRHMSPMPRGDHLKESDLHSHVPNLRVTDGALPDHDCTHGAPQSDQTRSPDTSSTGDSGLRSRTFHVRYGTRLTINDVRLMSASRG